MLTTPSEHYRTIQRLVALAVSGVQRRRNRSLTELSAFVVAMQIAAARAGAASVPKMLEEQGVSPVAQAAVAAAAFGGDTPNGAPLADLLGSVTAPDAPLEPLRRLAWTLVADAGRMGQSVATTATPAATGHVRYLNPPSCGRCAVLAGRVYRWSDGFLRHPQCDCVMLPVGESPESDLIHDPEDAFESGQIKGLSQAETEAIEAGADLGQVINVRRKKAGLSRAGRVLQRGRQPTPEGIYAMASDRAEAVELLRRFGYITT